MSSKSVMRVYVACSLVSGAALAAALLAYHFSGPVVGPASAQSEGRLAGGNTLAEGWQSHDQRAVRKAELTEKQRQPGANTPVNAKTKVIDPVVISRVDVAQERALVTGALITGSIDTTEIKSSDEDDGASLTPWTPPRADTYHTVCVRLCDGAYVPVSFATTRDRFKTDAARCKANCGVPAQLFVSKLPSVEAEDLVDVHGFAYVDLPNAFKFRTSYDPSCTCRSRATDHVARADTKDADVAQATHELTTHELTTQEVATGGTASLSPSAQAKLAQGRENANPRVEQQAPARDVPTRDMPTTTASTRARGPDSPAVLVLLQPVAPVEIAVIEPTLAQPVTAPSAVKVPKVVVTSEAPKSEAVKSESKRSKKAATVASLSPAKDDADDVPPKSTSRRDREVKIEKTAKPAKSRKTDGVVVTLPRPAPQTGATRVMVARADGASRAQRSFRDSADYWRLSFWEPRR